MKAIILAAGEGKRMQPYTFEKPKPMIEILGKPLLHHLFDSLPDKVDEVILVVGYKAEQIKDYFGVVFGTRRIHYVYQEKPTGTGHAVQLSRPYLTRGEKFLVAYADDLHDKRSLEKCISHSNALLVAKSDMPQKFGVIEVDESNRILGIEEKPDKPKSDLVAIGVYVLDEKIFNFEPTIHKGEYFLTSMIEEFIHSHPVYAVESHFWLPVGYPEDLPKAEEALIKRGHPLPKVNRLKVKTK